MGKRHSSADGEEEYEVEGILNHRIRNRTTEYYVKWKGYDHEENSWEPEANLRPHAEELLNEYRKDLATKNTRQKRGRKP